jgi:hypothetical protein
MAGMIAAVVQAFVPVIPQRRTIVAARTIRNDILVFFAVCIANETHLGATFCAKDAGVLTEGAHLHCPLQNHREKDPGVDFSITAGC